MAQYIYAGSRVRMKTAKCHPSDCAETWKDTTQLYISDSGTSTVTSAENRSRGEITSKDISGVYIELESAEQSRLSIER
jgi:hypothetical protein